MNGSARRSPAEESELRVRTLLLLGCALLAGCDQFASVGVLTTSPDAALAIDSDAMAGGAADATIDDAGRGDGGVDRCPEAAIAVCDPIQNIGCPSGLSMQCAIDYAARLTGYCIYNAPPALGMSGECLNTGITESCPPQFTCFAERCAKICLCDAECGAGQCCSQPIDRTGFSVCSDC